MEPSSMEPSSIQYAAYVGLDWADREHAWCLQTPDHMSRDSGFVAQTPEAIEAWAAALARRFQGRPVAVALEQSRGALLFALTKYAHLILYPLVLLGWHIIGRASVHPAPRTTRATRNSCLTTFVTIETSSGHCSRTPKIRGHCRSWSKHGAGP